MKKQNITTKSWQIRVNLPETAPQFETVGALMGICWCINIRRFKGYNSSSTSQEFGGWITCRGNGRISPYQRVSAFHSDLGTNSKSWLWTNGVSRFKCPPSPVRVRTLLYGFTVIKFVLSIGPGFKLECLPSDIPLLLDPKGRNFSQCSY